MSITNLDTGFKPVVAARPRLDLAAPVFPLVQPDALADLHIALERQSFDELSRARQALRRRASNTMVLPLASPTSPAWLGGAH